MIGIDRLLMPGGVVADDLDIDPDLAQRLADIVAGLARLLEPRRRQKPDPEPAPVAVPRDARLVEQGLGPPRNAAVDRAARGIDRTSFVPATSCSVRLDIIGSRNLQ